MMLVLPELTLPECSLRLACPLDEVARCAGWLMRSISWPETNPPDSLPRIDMSQLAGWPAMFVQCPVFGIWLSGNLDLAVETSADEFRPVHLRRLKQAELPPLEHFESSRDPAGAVIFCE